MKCDICGQKVNENFLNKPIGTYIWKKKKKKLVCSECQSKLTKEEIDEKI
ncbi:hypothetical protein JXB31_03880 [Candidatus Woesearchaeota archaeon]|nr:hypothetical protein [Candidatus Woesearchaeota archaeon]